MHLLQNPALWTVPFRRGTGRCLDRLNDTAIQLSDQSREVIHDLLPTICFADGVLSASRAPLGGKRERGPEAQPVNLEPAVKVRLPSANVEADRAKL